MNFIEDNNLVYSDHGLGLIFMPEKRAQEVANIWKALMESKTWGEFRSRVAKNKHRDLAERLMSGFEEVADEERFTPNELVSYEDPVCHPEIEMHTWMPEDIREKFGKSMHYTSCDGCHPREAFLELDRNQLDEILRVLEKQGYSCRKDDQLINDAYGSEFNMDDYSWPDEEEGEK